MRWHFRTSHYENIFPGFLFFCMVSLPQHVSSVGGTKCKEKMQVNIKVETSDVPVFESNDSYSIWSFLHRVHSAPWMCILHLVKEINIFCALVCVKTKSYWECVKLPLKRLVFIPTEQYNNLFHLESSSFVVDSWQFVIQLNVYLLTTPNDSLRKFCTFPVFNASFCDIPCIQQGSCSIAWEIYKGRQGNSDTETSRDKEE